MPTLIPLPPAPDLADTVIVPVIQSVPTSRWKEPDPTYAPAPEPETVSDEQAPARRLSTPLALAIGSAVIILCAIGYVASTFHFGNPAKPAPPVTQVKPSPVRQPLEPPPAAPPLAVVPAKPPVVTPPVIVKPPVPAPVAARPRNCSIEISDIPRYLNYAESNSSKGQYDRAISEYNQVLGCQPGNRPAQDGLRRAQDAEKYSSR